ncbi:DNA repair protein RadC [Tahibacter aquaticus]|uniref:DNA repair protein RadC n=1 Tax=Tahibacter aquaticus TaxID=520092 RepID=A0A4R6YSD6_9GAMM|nr:JAB domain-containing protein [Tahibacter aquaticus]TDR41161.1 DNA repair protein RadC [Tahibacter aquaticus]
MDFRYLTEFSDVGSRTTLARALDILEAQARKPGPALASSHLAAEWFRIRLSPLSHEVLAVAWLNPKLHLLEFRELAHGTLDRVMVYPREVVKSALAANAWAGILAHNHPSGDAEPSDADIALTHELQAALRLVDVKLLDHFIVTAAQPPFSMAQARLLVPEPGLRPALALAGRVKGRRKAARP